MAIADRKAEAIWEGNLTQGKGTVTPGSGDSARCPSPGRHARKIPMGEPAPKS